MFGANHIMGAQRSARQWHFTPAITDWTIPLELFRMRKARRAPVLQRAPRIFAIEQSTPRVPRQYRALYIYLERRYASVVVLTFEQIEALRGFTLPAPTSRALLARRVR